MPIKKNSIDIIAEHVTTLNHELGGVKIDISEVKNDVVWIKKIIGYIAALGTAGFVAVAGAVIKYIFLS